MAEVDLDDDEELARLVKFMARAGKRFGLALARYQDPRHGAEQREAALALVDGLNVTVLGLPSTSEDGSLADTIERLSAAAEAHDVVFVTGLDTLASDVDGCSLVAQALGQLNLRRDELPGLVPARVVFWILADAYPRMAELAWDLVEVMVVRVSFSREYASDDESEPELPMMPAWIELAAEGELEQLRAQAKSFELSAAGSGLEGMAGADAAASAGLLFARLGEFETAAFWMQRAALAYEGAEEQLAATIHYRRQAELLKLSGQLTRARSAAKRAIRLSEGIESLPGQTEWVAANGVLASLGEVSAGRELEDFVRTHFGAVRRFFRAKVPQPDVEDFTQEVIVKLVSAAGAGLEPDMWRSRLWSIARDLLRTYYRRKYPGSLGGHESLVDAMGIDGRDRRLDLREALLQLPSPTSRAIELVYLLGLTYEEAARELGIPQSTLRSRIARGLHQLQLALGLYEPQPW